jgi:membrane-associated phospholipid phosphatase
MQDFNYRNFKIASGISFIIAIILFTFSYYIGKKEFFLLLNTDLGIIADYFFGIFTNAGDSLMWIAVLAIIFYKKRKPLLPLIIWSFVFVTIFTQVCKYLIVPDEPRPWKAIADHTIIHHVFFIEPWLISSFPSGHTATAFTFYLLICLVSKKNYWLWIGLMLALLVGYSRIYLAQHFPFDVAGGIMTAIASVALSVVVLNWWSRRKKI